MTTQMKSDLFCLHCNKECEHTITYLGKHLQDIGCDECGIHIHIDKLKIMEHYAESVVERLLTKPHRINEEIKKGLSSFLKSLPIRVIKKPYEVTKEVLEVFKDSLKKDTPEK